MSKRKKIEDVEESEEEVIEEIQDENEAEEEVEKSSRNLLLNKIREHHEATEKPKIIGRKEGIVVEEELEKEMKERLKIREEKEKIAYEENRLKKWYINNKENIRLMVFSFFLFLMLSIGIISAFGLYAILGVTTQELVLIICSTLILVGAVIFIYIGQKYLLK
ncbi:MAG: hypothetical protein HWN67_08460 [Candidatus Helarchaeota archaeon]|nr:hypothetical protein [Candidatus Helarchaeota archaeon]